MEGVLVEKVLPCSIAHEVGLEEGDRILEVNGRGLRDLLDFRFYTSGEELVVLLVEKGKGERWEVEIEKDPEEDLGLVLEGIKPRHCGCKCIFCFMDQMPPGMRSSLYFKDDDFRLSFLYGNYITLTNLTKEDWERLEEQRLSPLYVSIHATDPRVRAFMMGNPRAARGYEELRRLVALGIKVHVQVVLCPGINDGPIFERTLDDLLVLYPGVASVALVPVGLTRYREGLYPLVSVGGEYARAVVDMGHTFRERARALVGDPFLYLADEWYIAADLPLPPLDYYGDLAQLEDGVGMVSLFMEEWRESVYPGVGSCENPTLLVTGEAFAPFLKSCIRSSPWASWVRVLEVKNRFFGSQVTVAGLLTARDVLDALVKAPRGEVFIPSVMLNEEGRFLDDLTPQDVAHLSGRKVKVVDPHPAALVRELSSSPWKVAELLD
ncbi:MAG TPA: DUF512 domain-containing protein [Thermosulfidibacter takaii]|uniref:DUF512 domain-containing protein n=1 Tax=Thermosulfidibacter takaii TaxID=412593 RepID=A0A7C0YBC4_9BACT|nr:DUF512 domain-containing protein [Thermosulfidibacter takaii]